MRFFIDTAKVEDIKKANDMGVICGVTTNPSLIAKEGRDFVEVIKEIAVSYTHLPCLSAFSPSSFSRLAAPSTRSRASGLPAICGCRHVDGGQWVPEFL